MLPMKCNDISKNIIMTSSQPGRETTPSVKYVTLLKRPLKCLDLKLIIVLIKSRQMQST
jgi:hypothetical protein